MAPSLGTPTVPAPPARHPFHSCLALLATQSTPDNGALSAWVRGLLLSSEDIHDTTVLTHKVQADECNASDEYSSKPEVKLTYNLQE